MDILIALISIIASIIAGVSFSVIRYAALRPANGELKTLAALERKIILNQQSLLKTVANCHLA